MMVATLSRQGLILLSSCWCGTVMLRLRLLPRQEGTPDPLTMTTTWCAHQKSKTFPKSFRHRMSTARLAGDHCLCFNASHLEESFVLSRRRLSESDCRQWALNFILVQIWLLGGHISIRSLMIYGKFWSVMTGESFALTITVCYFSLTYCNEWNELKMESS